MSITCGSLAAKRSCPVILPVQGIKFGTPDSIQFAILKMHAQAGNTYIVTAGCEIPAGTPIENLQAFCKYTQIKK